MDTTINQYLGYTITSTWRMFPILWRQRVFRNKLPTPHLWLLVHDLEKELQHVSWEQDGAHWSGKTFNSILQETEKDKGSAVPHAHTAVHHVPENSKVEIVTTVRPEEMDTPTMITTQGRGPTPLTVVMVVHQAYKRVYRCWEKWNNYCTHCRVMISAGSNTGLFYSPAVVNCKILNCSVLLYCASNYYFHKFTIFIILQDFTIAAV